jgi:hypothetical protein
MIQFREKLAKYEILFRFATSLDMLLSTECSWHCLGSSNEKQVVETVRRQEKKAHVQKKFSHLEEMKQKKLF